MSITKLTNSGLSGDKYPNLMADNTFMEPIATTLVGAGGSSSVTFSNIPQNYKHLQVRAITIATVAGQIRMRMNGDTGSNYSFHQVSGNGASTFSTAGTSQTGILQNFNTATSTTQPLALIVDILDYTNQNKYKTTRTLAGIDTNGAGTAQLVSGLWMNTSAITSLVFTDTGGNLAQYSRFSLYGIRG